MSNHKTEYRHTAIPPAAKMIRFSKEVSLGTVIQVIGYIVMVIYFTAQIQSNIIILRHEFDAMKTQIQYLQMRLDGHIDKTK